MKAADINAAIAADPMTEFAIRQACGGTRVVLIRGITPVRAGLWKYFEINDGRGWERHSAQIASTKIIPKAWATARKTSAGASPTLAYPEHAKLRDWKERTQAAGEFMDWLSERGLGLCHTVDDFPCHTPIVDLLAQWSGIDQSALEGEKLAMLAKLRGEES